MRTVVEFVDELGNIRRLRELEGFFASLRDRDDKRMGIVSTYIPRWLQVAFAPEKTDREVEIWLEQWRAVSDKLAFERASGWTEMDWLHWFSSDNEFWSLADVSLNEGECCLRLYLVHHDEPVPIEALRWMAIVGHLQVRAVSRLE
ncbi:hypothetical protein [Phytohabitans aurantiacus]|jgi:hypothetical protein|uniref:Uncharacterized protein n=1 Tax=Phytohabitans aurantiacus TaxID=3016789 RepID=A0ABQ5R0W7_9ACTN|nr:hypothetical protein [Phytohabitans aurantiacus]GLI00452.1 hypothetical protein Pa4123_57280 [Phytohabitans aurantiacus]